MPELSRRAFIKLGGILLLGLSAFGIPLDGWTVSSPGIRNKKRLVVVFLRGGADGLNIVVPHGAPEYYQARPTIAIKKPGSADGALDLDGYFGLHPALANLMPYWKQGQLAFVHSSGLNSTTRSHFDAQDYMESGTPGVKATDDGWMNRLLQVLPGEASPTRAVNFGPTMPRIFKGTASVASVATRKNGVDRSILDYEQAAYYFNKLYDGNDKLSLAYQEGLEARQSLMESLSQEQKIADRGAPRASKFFKSGKQVGQLINNDPTVQCVFLALGGWDTHVNQGAAKGALANQLKPLGDGLAGIAQALGPELNNTSIVVMSEFGRTVKENGNRGTDHGHGNVMWLLGGGIKGKKVYGNWQGLLHSALYQGRDLAITTDFRAVLSGVLTDHMGLSSTAVGQVFPGFTVSKRF